MVGIFREKKILMQIVMKLNTICIRTMVTISDITYYSLFNNQTLIPEQSLKGYIDWLQKTLSLIVIIMASN